MVRWVKRWRTRLALFARGNAPLAPPFLTVQFGGPHAMRPFDQSWLPHDRTEWDDAVLSPKNPIASVVVGVAPYSLLFHTLLAVLVCAMPILFLGLSVERPRWYVSHPCTASPVDMRVPVMGFALCVALVLVLWYRRIGKRDSAYQLSTGRGIEPRVTAAIDSWRTVNALRRYAGQLAIALVLACAGALLFTSVRDAILPWVSQATAPAQSCSWDDVSKWAKALSLDVPKVLYPVAMFVAIGFVLSVVAAIWAPRVWDKAGHKAREAALLSWLHATLFAPSQAELLRDQARGIDSSWPFETTYSIVSWLAKTSYLFPERYSEGATEEPDSEPQTRRAFEQRTFYRLTYAPVVVPVVAFIALPVVLNVMEWAPSGPPHVPKWYLLPGLIAWVLWSGQFLALLGSNVYGTAQRMRALSPAYVQLLASHPDVERLYLCAQSHAWPRMTQVLWLAVSLAFAVLVSWYGAF